MKALPLALLFLASGSALADDAAILKCRTLADTPARLACYDAIPVGAQAGAAPVAAAPVRTPEQSFGLEVSRLREEQPKAIVSTIKGDFEGWGPGTQFRLANGQVWRVVDGSEAVLPRSSNPKVTIERNVFGTLFLKVDGSNNSAKVRRVQ
ncbi:hypothetical protein [Massilia niastensis]|uniref:hypothetical protein n=1 Tax=Massilia niastensis TaxID=544911 RepID=UPI0003788156|nr:hypothetical protein [Massilia niastensis]